MAQKYSGIRRLQSSTNQRHLINEKTKIKINQNDDFENIEKKVNNEILIFEKILDKKIDNIVENLKSSNNDRFLSIEKILSEKLENIYLLINNITLKQQQQNIEQKINYEHKYKILCKYYDNLEKKYYSERLARESHFLKFTNIINSYETIILRLCSSHFPNDQTFSEEVLKIANLKKQLSSDDENSSTKDNEQTIITNPLVSHRYSAPITKSSSKEINKNKEDGVNTERSNFDINRDIKDINLKNLLGK